MFAVIKRLAMIKKKSMIATEFDHKSRKEAGLPDDYSIADHLADHCNSISPAPTMSVELEN